MRFVCVLVTLLCMWSQGEQIKADMAFSLLAMIYFMFFSVTGLMLYAMNTIAQLVVLFKRLGDVYKMEEYKKTRIEQVPQTEVCVQMKEAAFSWGFRLKKDQVVGAIRQVEQTE